MLRQHQRATTTTRGTPRHTPRQRMLSGDWAEYRYALLKATPYDQVEAVFLDSVRRKSQPKRDAILREMESLEGEEQREYVLRTLAGFRPSLR